MREPTIARNYAEALFAAGERAGAELTETFVVLLEGVAGAIEADERVRLALESPRVPKPVKQRIVERALARRAPEQFIRFLTAVIRRDASVRRCSS